jgi:carboxymethylenebutenolidase
LDRFVPAEARQKVAQELRAIANVEVYDYPGVDHAFARFRGDHYDAAAAQLANARTATFLHRHLG